MSTFSFFNGFSFWNIGVISATFSSFGNSFFLMPSLIQFANSLQISLFARLPIFVGITPIAFLFSSNEVHILKMSPLVTKLKSNSFDGLNDNLVLVMQM